MQAYSRRQDQKDVSVLGLSSFEVKETEPASVYFCSLWSWLPMALVMLILIFWHCFTRLQTWLVFVPTITEIWSAFQHGQIRASTTTVWFVRAISGYLTVTGCTRTEEKCFWYHSKMMMTCVRLSNKALQDCLLILSDKTLDGPLEILAEVKKVSKPWYWHWYQESHLGCCYIFYISYLLYVFIV